MNRPQVYNDRPIIVLQLPLDDGVAVKRPEQVVLRVGRATFDIGAFCYADRELAVRGGNRIAQRGVVLKSLLPHRPDQIRKVIDYISSLLTDRGLRIETVTTFFKYFTAYMNWADSNGYFNC